MPHYSFRKDHKIARKTERQIADYLVAKGYEFIDECNNADYDIRMRTPSGDVITIEIKEDFSCQRTGNVGLEYHCRGKPSGISVSKADFYLYKVHEPNGEKNMYIIKTSELKEMVENKLWFREVNGGDPGSNSLNYLFKLGVIKNRFKVLRED
jgi:hypothetical protein